MVFMSDLDVVALGKVPASKGNRTRLEVHVQASDAIIQSKRRSAIAS